MHPMLGSLFAAWDTASVRWCLLRVPASPDAPEGDVDLLVHAADADAMARALDSHGFVRLPARGYGTDAFFLGYHPGTDHWIWLHVATRLTFGPAQNIRSGQAEVCLLRRERQGAAWILNPDDAFWVLLLHCLVDKGRVPDRHRDRLQVLAPSATAQSPVAEVAARLLPEGCSLRQVIETVWNVKWEAVEALVPRLRVPAPLPRVLAIRALRLLTRLQDAHRRGLSVALMGPDGAGKSTLVKGIQASFFFPSASVYMGVGTGAIAGIACRLSLFHRPPFTYFAYLSTLWLRYLTGQYHRLRGRLVIFDRYSYDALLPMPGGVSHLKARALQIQARIYPPPDLVLVLDVPGEVMFSRKGEFTPEHLEAQRQALLSLHDRLPRVEVLDGTLPRDAVRTEAVRRIWQQYIARLQPDSRRAQP
jgi:thymidylate kinase